MNEVHINEIRSHVSLSCQKWFFLSLNPFMHAIYNMDNQFTVQIRESTIFNCSSALKSFVTVWIRYDEKNWSCKLQNVNEIDRYICSKTWRKSRTGLKFEKKPQQMHISSNSNNFQIYTTTKNNYWILFFPVSFPLTHGSVINVRYKFVGCSNPNQRELTSIHININ